MSLWSSIKSVGRAIDPTNAKAPLGSIVAKALDGGATAFGAPPGVVSTGLAMAGAANRSTPGAVPSATVQAPTSLPFKVSQPAAAPGLGSRLLGAAGTTTGTMVGLAVAALLGLYLVMRRK